MAVSTNALLLSVVNTQTCIVKHWSVQIKCNDAAVAMRWEIDHFTVVEQPRLTGLTLEHHRHSPVLQLHAWDLQENSAQIAAASSSTAATLPPCTKHRTVWCVRIT